MTQLFGLQHRGDGEFDTQSLSCTSFGEVCHADNLYSINLCLPSYGFWRTHS